MEGYVIITKKEDLKEIIREVLGEINMPKSENTSDQRFFNIDGLLVFLSENSCGISKSQIYKLTRLNKIPHRKIGKKLLFNKDDILNWIQEPK